jgi:hypothetical protein
MSSQPSKRKLDTNHDNDDDVTDIIDITTSKPIEREPVTKKVKLENTSVQRRKRKRKHGTIKVREFFPDEDIKLGYLIAVLGRHGSGKSVVTKSLCLALSTVIDLVIVFCPTAEENGYPEFVPPMNIYEDWDEDFILDLVKSQKKEVLRGEAKDILIILDDCAFDSKMFRSKAFRKLFFNGRHARITVIITSQYALDMPPPIRAQLDLTFTAIEFSDNTLERLHDNYFSMINKYNDFKRILMKIARNRCMLVMHNIFSDSNKIDELLYWYKAQFPVPEFKMCAPEVWEASEQSFVDDTDEKEERERKIKEIEAQILEDKQPIYDIVKDTSRPHIPENSLRAQKRKRSTIFNADAKQIAPKAMRNLRGQRSQRSQSTYGLMKRKRGRPNYNLHTARAYHSQPDISHKRMKGRFGY